MISKNYAKQCCLDRLMVEVSLADILLYPASGAKVLGFNSNVLSDGSFRTTAIFTDDISSEEIVEIDEIISAHIPIPIPEPEIVTDPRDDDKKLYVRAEPRPLGCTTVFASAGDFLGSGSIPPLIGGGEKVQWDASIANEWTTINGIKQKIIDVVFCDTIYLRGGHIFSPDSPKGSSISFQVMCPPGGYYMNLGQVKVNTTGDWLKVDENVVDVPLSHGDDAFFLDSFTASNGLPSGYRLRFVIKIPVAEVNCFGSLILLLYRERSVVV